MTILSRASCRRLQQLPQIPSIWEGDRRSLSQDLAANFDVEPNMRLPGDCILWIDGAEGIVRAIDIVPSDTGHEAVVRTLLRAIENPHGAADPARPKKIVVRDRELQFFLRGALQNLDISIEYAAELPLIDEIFEGLQNYIKPHQPELPDAYATRLLEQAHEIWRLAPWEILDEQQIIAVELNRWDVETLYLSVLGMMGVEFGILMYRSLDSLRLFRQRVLRGDQSPKQMQQAFLEQDCIFLTFEAEEDDEDDLPDLDYLPGALEPLGWMETIDPSAITDREPSFGSLHPLEGLRTALAPEEAAAAMITLEAFQRFVQQQGKSLRQENWPSLNKTYRLPNPEPDALPKTVSVTIRTLPDLAQELMEMTDESSGGSLLMQPSVLQDDLVPEDSIVSLDLMPWDWVEQLQETSRIVYESMQPSLPRKGKGLPVISIQTSQPKAEQLVSEIQSLGGLQAVCFNLGEDPFSGEAYDLVLAQTQDGIFHLLIEYLRQDPNYMQHRQKWERNLRSTQKACGIAIAGGVTGKNKGNPQPRNYIGLFEVPLRTPEELGLSPLQLQFELDWI